MYGQLFMTCLEEDIHQMMMSGVQPIVLTDDAQDYRYTSLLTCPMLLPPYDAMEAEINQDFENAQMLYIQHLNRPDVQKLIATIIEALRMGKSIVLYIPDSDAAHAFKFPLILTNYFARMYGIMIHNRITGQFMAGPSVVENQSTIGSEAVRMCMLLMNDAIKIEDFALHYPENAPIDFDVAVKLIIASHNQNDFSQLSNEAIIDYARRYMKSIKDSIINHKITPCLRVGV